MKLLKRNEDYPLFPSVFDDFFNTNWFDWTTKNFSGQNSTLPSVNVLEDEKEFQVEMAAPGMRKKDFKILLENNILNISSERKEEKKDMDKEKRFARKEFSYQSFTRSFTLPDVVEAEMISATYENGILKIKIPKKEEIIKKSRKKIEIS